MIRALRKNIRHPRTKFSNGNVSLELKGPYNMINPLISHLTDIK